MGLFFKKDKQERTQFPIKDSIETQFAKLIVRNPGIVLNKNELCVFAANAYIGKKKSKTVGYSTSGVRASTKVLGLNFHAGNTRVDRQKEEYWEKTPCRFFVTGDRFIALAEKGGFTIKASKILDMKLFSDAIAFYCENKTHTVFMTSSDIARYRHMWNVISEAQRVNLDYTKFF